MEESKNKQKSYPFLEMRQKLMERFLDGVLDQASYERLLADVEVMERAQRDSEPDASGGEPTYPQARPAQGNVYEIASPKDETPKNAYAVSLPASPAITLMPAVTAMNGAAMPMVLGYPPAGFYGIPQKEAPAKEAAVETAREMRVGISGKGIRTAQNGNGTGKFRKNVPSPEILPEVIQSLPEGQPLEIWWHDPLTDDCAQAWRSANVPIKLSLTMNPSITDESLQCLANVPRLRELNLTSTSITDEGLAFLAQLPELDSLILTSTRVEGKTAESLSTLRELRELTLTSSQFGDSGMRKIASLRNLEVLKLDDTQVTDEGMEFMAKLTLLRILNLQGSLVSDTGMEFLEGLESLEKLYVGGTIYYDGQVYDSPITNDGISFLKNLTAMRTLHLNDTQLTDSGLKAVRDMSRLTELNIADTQVTDGCLYHLRNLEQLRSIIVDGTSISLSGIRKSLGSDAIRRFHGASVGAWRRLGSFLKSPWSRKN